MSREKMLNRELIVPAIKKYCSENYKKSMVSALLPVDGNRHRVEITVDDIDFFVDFHFRPNGATSIDISSGRHLDKKKQIKDLLLNDPSILLVEGLKQVVDVENR
ncbi:MAG: hypothetical protein H6Q72_2585 [Firmicutes bacterium]|nr:hypothetical protein [Bacillota bacterium]